MRGMLMQQELFMASIIRTDTRSRFERKNSTKNNQMNNIFSRSCRTWQYEVLRHTKFANPKLPRSFGPMQSLLVTLQSLSSSTLARFAERPSDS
jgi:hypothetical protein